VGHTITTICKVAAGWMIFIGRPDQPCGL